MTFFASMATAPAPTTKKNALAPVSYSGRPRRIHRHDTVSAQNPTVAVLTETPLTSTRWDIASFCLASQLSIDKPVTAAGPAVPYFDVSSACHAKDSDFRAASTDASHPERICDCPLRSIKAQGTEASARNRSGLIANVVANCNAKSGCVGYRHSTSRQRRGGAPSTGALRFRHHRAWSGTRSGG